MKKIVLSQTCQGSVLRQLFLSSPEFAREFECTFIQNFELRDGKPGLAPRTALEQAIERCDVLIYHDIAHYDFPSLLTRMPSGSMAIKIPYITSTIYWPTHDAHNLISLLPAGDTSRIPWPCKILSKLIVSLGDKAKALDAYMNLDIPAAVRINRVYADQIAYLAKAERGSIFNITAFTEKNFRNVQLFHLINHPSLPVFVEVANTILAKLGLPLIKNVPEDPFATHQTPLHPSIISHYGLSWCDASTKYRIIDSSYSFEEYVALYIDAYVEKYGYAMYPRRFPKHKILGKPLRTIKTFFSFLGKRPA
jgi:hypothetical protein